METEKHFDQFSIKDRELWRLAKKRVGFRRHLATYLVINAMFWFIWWFSTDHEEEDRFPWPVWPMLGWGIGLIFNYLDAYVFSKSNAVEREYEKLRNK
jgi:hypothetical protein